MQNLKEQLQKFQQEFNKTSASVMQQKYKISHPMESYIDQTLLKPDVKKNNILELCQIAKKNKFKAVCIQPHYLTTASELLRGSGVLPITVVGFPLGANKTEMKVAETFSAIRDGAREIDMVINLSWAKDGLYQEITEEIYLVKMACGNTPLKVIVETAYLSREEKINLCACVLAAGADYIKTSTGFAPSGAQIEDILLFKQLLKDRVKIKASGGIKNYDQAAAFIEAGADRIGTSSGVEILTHTLTNTKDSY